MLVNMSKSVTTQDRAMRHTVIYSPQSVNTVNSLYEKKISCIIISVCAETGYIPNWNAIYCMYTETLFYLTACITLHSHHFLKQQTAVFAAIPLFLNWGPHISVRCIVVNVRFYVPFLKKRIEMFSLCSGTFVRSDTLTDTHTACYNFMSGGKRLETVVWFNDVCFQWHIDGGLYCKP